MQGKTGTLGGGKHPLEMEPITAHPRLSFSFNGPSKSTRPANRFTKQSLLNLKLHLDTQAKCLEMCLLGGHGSAGL